MTRSEELEAQLAAKEKELAAYKGAEETMATSTREQLIGWIHDRDDQLADAIAQLAAKDAEIAELQRRVGRLIESLRNCVYELRPHEKSDQGYIRYSVRDVIDDAEQALKGERP